jgi:hypothetical protein
MMPTLTTFDARFERAAVLRNVFVLIDRCLKPRGNRFFQQAAAQFVLSCGSIGHFPYRPHRRRCRVEALTKTLESATSNGIRFAIRAVLT